MKRLHCVVIGWCLDREIRTLVRGAAGEFGLESRCLSSLEEVLRAVKGTIAALLVVECMRMGNDLVKLMWEVRQKPGLSIVVILREMDEGSRDAVLGLGAVACLPAQITPRDLLWQLESAMEVVVSGGGSGGKSLQVLQVSEEVTLTLPCFYLADGDHGTSLPRILGALLACLAAHPDQIVPTQDLIRAAWGSAVGVTLDALYQQMHRLKSRLDEFGISERLETCRGRGYVLHSGG